MTRVIRVATFYLAQNFIKPLWIDSQAEALFFVNKGAVDRVPHASSDKLHCFLL